MTLTAIERKHSLLIFVLKVRLCSKCFVHVNMGIASTCVWYYRNYTGCIARCILHAMLRRAQWCHSKSSVCPSVCLSVTFTYDYHTGWNTSKIISRPNSLRYLLTLTPTWAIWSNGNTLKIGWNRGGVMSTKTCNIWETVLDRTKVTMTDWYEVAYALSITGWAVAQTCCISQCSKYRKSGIFGYPWEQNPWTDRHETGGA